MIKIQDVAKEAGVSTATVSRMINSHPSVSPEMASKVQAAIDKLNYKPNTVVRKKTKKISRTILVIVTDYSNPFWGDILEGMDKRAREEGYTILLAANYGNVNAERELIKLLHKKQADGVIFLSPLLSKAELKEINARYPVVQCCEYIDDETLARVSIDNYSACYSLMTYLLRCGHTKLAMLGSSNGFISSIARELAFQKALEDHGIAFEEQMIHRGTYTFESGYQGAQIFLQHAQRPTALVAVSDMIAAGAISAIHAAAMNVPKDIAVAGFDNVSISRMLNPTLTTVAQPRKQLGVTAMNMIFDLINGDMERRVLYLPHELIVRESTM